jgi:hypothetical protein
MINRLGQVFAKDPFDLARDGHVTVTIDRHHFITAVAQVITKVSADKTVGSRD